MLRLLDGIEVSLPDGRTAWTTKDWRGDPCFTFIGWKMNPSDWVRAAAAGLILEFGVAGGGSLRKLCESAYPQTVYGFDWWKGLPHDWNEYDLRGACRADKPEPPPNGVLIDGLFSDTLEGFLDEHSGPVGLVHIDCDLYCPTAFVLHCLMARFVKGSIIAFDEINQHGGEKEAFARYLAISGQTWELKGKQHAFGEVYQCVDSGCN